MTAYIIHIIMYCRSTFYILCCYVALDHYLISILFGGYATFCNKVVFCIQSPSAAFMMHILINYYKTIHIAHYPP